MTPQDALSLINQTIRQINTTADNHDLLKEAVGTLARMILESKQDEKDAGGEEEPDV